jgi:hypothetical protein
MNTYVYKTTDAGKTWTSIVTSDIRGFARNLQEDRVNPDLLFLGTEFGLFITIDGGKNWLKFTNGVPTVAVHYIKEHPVTNDIILGTHGRGIIIIDDISPLRQLTPEVLAKKLHFFKTMPYEMDETSNFGGSSGETQFVGANPSSSAKIIYYLSGRHTFGKMTLDIYDENDKWITSLSPGKQKGINIVEWGFNSMAPTVATGKTIAGGAMFAPRVPAGKYKAVIMKGTEKFETIIEVTYPKKSIFTAEERLKQQETVKTMYVMTEELAYMVYQIDEYLAQSEKVMKENASLKKQALKFNTDLMALKKTLVITTGDNYVGAAEKQLREKIGDLFSTIGAYYGAPSTTQLESLTMLQTAFAEAKKRFKEIQIAQLAKFNTATEKAGFVFETMKSFEEYVKKN